MKKNNIEKLHTFEKVFEKSFKYNEFRAFL